MWLCLILSKRTGETYSIEGNETRSRLWLPKWSESSWRPGKFGERHSLVVFQFSKRLADRQIFRHYHK